MEDWKEELLDKAQQIKTETQEGANTNVRVGGLFEEVINRLGEGSLKEPISSMNGNVAGTMMANTVVARNERNTGWEYKVLNSGSTESSILADLTNEMDAVALDGNLKAEYSTQVWTTIVLHYGGSTPQITNIVATCSVPTVIIYPEQNSSGYTGRVRVTVPQGTDFRSGSVIISITATCSEGSGTADFTIMGVKQGADGQSAVVYQLMPSVSAIKRDSSNVYTTTSISCSIQKRLGTGGVSAVDPVLPDPSEPGRETLYIRYSIDGSPYADYTGTIRFDSLNNPPVSTIGFILLQYNAEQVREIIIDKETVPVVLDGIDGATPFVVDIDNEMSAIPVNENGHVVTDKQITLNISGFFGSMSVTSDCEANVATEAIAYLSGYNITVTQGRTAMQLIVQIAASESVVMPGVIDIPIDVHSDSYGNRKLTFTLCTVKSGGQGEDAEIYQLKPNYSSIPFYRTAEGVLIGEYNFKCQIQKTVGSTTTVYEPNALTGYAVYYQFSRYGSSPSEEALLEGPITIDTTTVASYNRLELELWKLDDLGVKSLRLDRETIPLLSDGQKGEDGKSPIYYDIDTEGIMTITRHLDGNYTPSTIQAQAIEHIGNEQNNAIDKYEDMVLYAFYGTTEKPQDPSAYEYIDHNTLTDPKTLTAHVQEKIGLSHGFVYFQLVKKQDNTEIVVTSKRVAVIDEIAGPEGESVYVADLDNPMDSVSCNESGGIVSAQTVRTTISLYYGSQESSFNISSLARNGNAITIGTTTNGVTPTYLNHVLSIRYESGVNGATISNGKDVYTITITKELEDATITRTLYFTVNGIVGVTYNLLLPVKEIKAVVNENNQYVVDGETTYALRCGYIKNNNGTITSVNDENSIIDNNYCIYFRRHTRGGSWDSNYTAYYQNPNWVRNFNVNTYDAIVFYFCKNKGGSVQTLEDILDYEDIYVVADGKKGDPGVRGKPGEDGYSIIINPEYAIFDEVVSGQTTSVNTSNWVGRIQLFKGSLAQSARIHVLTCSNCSFSQRSGDTRIVNNYSYYSDDIVFGFSISTSGGVFPSEGYLLCEVESQEQVDNSPVFIKENIKIPFYINKLGTFDRKIENGIETATGNAKEYTDSQNDVLKSDYETKITTSAKDLTQQFTEQISRAGNYGRNLFGFHKGVEFNNFIPFIQGYGIVSGSGQCDIRYLGFGGETGYYTVSFEAKMLSSSKNITFSLDANGEVTNNKTITTSWTRYTLTFNVTGYGSSSFGLFYISGMATSNRIVIRHLKIERGQTATKFCEADEDVAYLGHGNVAKNLDFAPYRTEDAENQTVDGRSGVYRIRVPYLTNTYPWGNTTFWDYLYKDDVFNLEEGKCYTLSFWAKSSVNGFIITQYLYKDNYSIINTVGVDLYVDPSNGTIQESIVRDGQTQIKLSTTWTQYFVHFYVANNVPSVRVVPLRVLKSYNNSSARNLAYIYMSDIELQEGYVTPTDYFASFINQNARRISLVQQSGTKLAGIDIQNGTVNLMGDRVIFSNSTGTVSGNIWIDPDDGTIHAINGEFNGTVKTKLLYSPVKIIPSSSYTINPSSDPYHSFLSEGSAPTTITLPNPTTYDGMEIQFFCPWLTRSSIYATKVTYSGGIYYPDPSQSSPWANSLSNSKTVTLRFNSLSTFKAMDGYWYMIQGNAST